MNSRMCSMVMREFPPPCAVLSWIGPQRSPISEVVDAARGTCNLERRTLYRRGRNFYSGRDLDQFEVQLWVAHRSGGLHLALRNARGCYLFQHVENGCR